MAKSLLHMISNDIGQLACLYAKLHNLSRVYFGGFFIRGHPVTMHTITYSINYFTKVPIVANVVGEGGWQWLGSGDHASCLFQLISTVVQLNCLTVNFSHQFNLINFFTNVKFSGITHLLLFIAGFILFGG